MIRQHLRWLWRLHSTPDAILGDVFFVILSALAITRLLKFTDSAMFDLLIVAGITLIGGVVAGLVKGFIDGYRDAARRP